MNVEQIPAHTTLKTPWTDKVNRSNPFPEYPRPTLVRKNWQHLNGEWDLTITDQDKDVVKLSKKILVPFAPESALSGIERMTMPTEQLRYKRTLTIPANWKSQRIHLHFGAVDWHSKILVNGKQVGEHKGGYNPFTLDITDALTADAEQTLEVIVTDPTDTGDQARGKQVLKPNGIWYTPISGIWQSVWMEPVPSQGIKSYEVVTNLQDSSISLKVKKLVEDKRTTIQSVIVEVLDGRNVVAKQTVNPDNISTIKIPNPKLWHPDKPFLYDLKLTYTEDGKTVDSVKGYFGMREIRVGTDRSGFQRFMLNNEPLFQFGPLDQGFWPDGLYTPPTEEAFKFDIEAVKKMGGNMLRKHVKVEPERFYWMCDKMGILVWQDMPSGDNKTPESHKQFSAELVEMVNALRKHPSIVMWVPFNEGWGQHNTVEVGEMVKRLDPSRLVNQASGWTDHGKGDMHDVHIYPGPAMAPLETFRPSVLGEYGGLGLPLEGHTWLGKDNWGYVSYPDSKQLTAAYIDQLKKLDDLHTLGLAAAVYTQTSDVEVEVNGWLTYDRQVWKIKPADVIAHTKKLYAPRPRVETILPTAGDGGKETWKYTTTQPGADWMKGGFADGGWQSGFGSFGTKETPGAVVGTVWNTSDIWLRKEFELDSTSKSEFRLKVHHDEDAVIYVNGVEAARLSGYTGSYVLVNLNEAGTKALKTGKNLIAVHCHQTRGGQNIDLGIVKFSR